MWVTTDVLKKIAHDLNEQTIHAQFAKSQEVSNVRALRIFERKVLLSIQTVEKFSNATFFRQIALQNLQRKNLGFSETMLLQTKC